MLTWLAQNGGTILAALALIAMVALIVAKAIRDAKRGKSCSCGCTHCAMSGQCKKKK